MDRLLNLALFAVVIYVVTLPGGWLGTRIGAWRTNISLAQAAEAHWEVLAETSARMDGNVGNPIALVEFGHYECSFCQRVQNQLEALMESQPGLAVGFRHFPPRGHTRAESAAKAAICAEWQGRFLEMNTLLFEVHATGSRWDPEEVATEASVPDLGAFLECIKGDDALRRLEEDRELGERLGVIGTPTFYFRFGGRIGYATTAELARLLREADGGA